MSLPAPLWRLRHNTVINAALKSATGREAILARMTEINKSIQVYKKSDFDNIIARFKETEVTFKLFTAPYINEIYQKMNKFLGQEA
jgi:hypothetical protein